MTQTNSLARTGLIIFIVLMFGVLVVLAVNLAPLLVQTNGALFNGSPAHQSLVTSGTSLVDAAALAEVRAREWTVDAALVRAEGTWIAPIEWQKMEIPPVAWSFSYYSSSEQELASVAVHDESVLWTQPREIPIVPTLLSSFPPAFGVDAAWLSFRAAGGDSLLADYPGTTVSFVLQPREGIPTWIVSARAEDRLVRIVMDAVTGTVSVP